MNKEKNTKSEQASAPKSNAREIVFGPKGVDINTPEELKELFQKKYQEALDYFNVWGYLKDFWVIWSTSIANLPKPENRAEKAKEPKGIISTKMAR